MTGRRRDADIALHRHVHPDEPDGPGEERPHQEGTHASQGDVPFRGREVQQGCEDEDQEHDGLELFPQVGVRPDANGLADPLHLLGALVVAQDLARQEARVDQAENGHP